MDDDMHDWLIEKTRHVVWALAGIAEYINSLPDYREVDDLGRPTRESILADDLHNALDKATTLLAYESDVAWEPRDRDSVMKYGQKAYRHLCRRYGIYGPEDQFPLPFVATNAAPLGESKYPIGSLNELEARWLFDTFNVQRPLSGSVSWHNEIFEEYQQRILLTNALEQASRYALHPEGWLLISGPHGVGKSHLAGSIIRRTSDAGLEVRYVVNPDLWARYRDTDDTLWREEQSLIESADLLVFDNLDIRYHLRGDKYLEHILRVRSRDHQPTILVAVGGTYALPGWISQVVTEVRVVASDYRPLLRR